MNPLGLTNAPMVAAPFSAEEKQRFDSELAEILTHYPDDRKSAAMLPALRLLQSMKGWLPPEGLSYVAERLGVTKERALEAHLEQRLGVPAGESNERFTLRETECLASCGTAPCLQINEEHHESLTLRRVDEILAKLP